MASKHLHGVPHHPAIPIPEETVRRLTRSRNSLAAGLDEQVLDCRTGSLCSSLCIETLKTRSFPQVSVSIGTERYGAEKVVPKAVAPHISGSESYTLCSNTARPKHPRPPWHQTHLQPRRFRQCACVPSFCTSCCLPRGYSPYSPLCRSNTTAINTNLPSPIVPIRAAGGSCTSPS